MVRFARTTAVRHGCVEDGLDVDGRRRILPKRGVARSQQQLDLRAAEYEAPRSGVLEPPRHVEITVAGRFLDRADAELFVDDTVHLGAVVGVWHEYVDPVLPHPLGVEPVLHREPGCEEPDPAQTV